MSPTRLGRYEVIGLLATGGMAEVHLGRLMGPSGFERVVVLKRILPHLAREAAFVDMFLDEARIVAKIDHPNVVQVIELGRDGDELYLAMELVEGESLGGFMRRHWVDKMQIGVELAAFIVAQACSGLHAAHELVDPDGRPQQIVHRDVSPQNIMITYTGRVKVLDFGIAKAIDRATRTRTGELKGKVEYMSPEQCRAEPLDRRSDVFALGVLLYELSVGKRLFRRGNEVASLRAVCEDPIPAPRSVDPDYPAQLESICLRALERDVDKRFATADEMRRELVAFLRTTPNVGVHDELLAERMRALFADRLENKTVMIRELRSGGAPAILPPPEVDLQVEPPVVATVATRPEPTPAAAGATAPGAPTERPRRAPLYVGAAAALLAASAFAIGGLRARPEAGETSPEPSAFAPVSPAAAEPSVTPATPASVVIEITTSPPGAHVWVGETDRGPTPQKLALDRGAEPVALELRLEGYEPLSERVTPDVDQRLALSLKPALRGRPPARPTAPPASSASGGRYRKFN